MFVLSLQLVLHYLFWQGSKNFILFANKISYFSFLINPKEYGSVFKLAWNKQTSMHVYYAFALHNVSSGFVACCWEFNESKLEEFN